MVKYSMNLYAEIKPRRTTAFSYNRAMQ